jgi:hypothetical protein
MAEENREHLSNISSQENNSTTENQPQMRVRRFTHEEGILRSLSQQENQREIKRSQELDEELTLPNSKKTISRKEKKRKCFLDLTQKGVNLPPLNKKDKKNLKNPLKELLKIEITYLLEK